MIVICPEGSLYVVTFNETFQVEQNFRLVGGGEEEFIPLGRCLISEKKRRSISTNYYGVFSFDELTSIPWQRL